MFLFKTSYIYIFLQKLHYIDDTDRFMQPHTSTLNLTGREHLNIVHHLADQYI